MRPPRRSQPSAGESPSRTLGPGSSPSKQPMAELPMLLITPEERAALQLLAEGKAIGDIAGVRFESLFARMGATNQTQAVEAALKRGLIPIPAPAATRDDATLASRGAFVPS